MMTAGTIEVHPARPVVRAGLVAATLAALVALTIRAGGTDAVSRGAELRPALPLSAVPGERQILGAYTKLPVSFVPNEGQADRRVRYYAQTTGLGVHFTRRDVRLAFVQGEHGTALILGFIGANPKVALAAREELPGKVNYLVGNDAAQWRTDLATYGEVVYRDLWPGIDMAVRGTGGTLKYEFLVRPGGRASDIGLAYRGASGLSLARSGSLSIATPLGVLTDSRPVSYQRVAGRRVPVASRYDLKGENRYGFSIGAYDRRRPLVIDPGLAYSTYLGGNGDDAAPGLAVDEDGNAYVSSRPRSTNFPTTPGAFQAADPDPAAQDGAVTKLDSTLSHAIYSTYLGGTGVDAAYQIAVDEDGYAYTTGVTYSSNFPTTPGSFQSTDPDPANSDWFVAKLARDGSRLVYSTYLGGNAEEEFFGTIGIAVDEDGRAHVAGETLSSNFPTTPGTFQPVDPDPGGFDAFVTKLNRAGSALVYSTYLGGTGNDHGQPIEVDGEGTAYVAGQTDAPNFPTRRAFQPTDPDAAGPDAFVAKLSESGSALVYSSYLGGTGEDFATGLDVEDGNAYVAGQTDAPDFPTTSRAFQSIDPDPGSSELFVTKVAGSGRRLAYSTYVGGNGLEFVTWDNVSVDEEGRAHVTGGTFAANFPTTPDGFQAADPDPGAADGVLAVLTSKGSRLAYSTYLGGHGEDFGTTVVAYDEDVVYLAGRTRSPDFPTTPGAFQPTDPDLGTNRDGAVTKFEFDDDDDDDD